MGQIIAILTHFVGYNPVNLDATLCSIQAMFLLPFVMINLATLFIYVFLVHRVVVGGHKFSKYEAKMYVAICYSYSIVPLLVLSYSYSI